MIKILITLLISCLTITAWSQGRAIDLAITSVTKPERVPSGGPLEVAFYVKNNGPDVLKAMDSIFYQVNILNGKRIFAKVYTLGNNLNSGDSLLISATFQVTNDTFTNVNGNLCINSHAMNRSADSIQVENGNNTSNNKSCRVSRFGEWEVSVFGPRPSNDMIVYPQPANSELNIDLSDKRITNLQIFNASGNLVKNIAISCPSNNFLSISVKDFPDGIYYIKCQNNNDSEIRKIIVVH